MQNASCAFPYFYFFAIMTYAIAGVVIYFRVLTSAAGNITVFLTRSVSRNLRDLYIAESAIQLTVCSGSDVI